MISANRTAKVTNVSSAAYRSQIDFQFGGAAKIAAMFKPFHQKEAERLAARSAAVEVFLFEDINYKLALINPY